MQITQDDEGKDFELQQGDTLDLTLAGNPTTGFRWWLESGGEPACESVSESFDAGAGTVGSSGVYRWVFRAAGPGQGRIKLVYGRRRQDSPPARAFEVSVNVKAGQ